MLAGKCEPSLLEGSTLQEIVKGQTESTGASQLGIVEEVEKHVGVKNRALYT